MGRTNSLFPPPPHTPTPKMKIPNNEYWTLLQRLMAARARLAWDRVIVERLLVEARKMLELAREEGTPEEIELALADAAEEEETEQGAV